MTRGLKHRMAVIGSVVLLAAVVAVIWVSSVHGGGADATGGHPTNRPTAGGGTSTNDPNAASGHATASTAARPTSSPSPSASSAPAPTTGSSGTGKPVFVLPPGWQMRNDGTGFSVPVPDGWQFGRDSDGRALWRNPSHSLLLLIDQSRHPKSNPVQDWLNNEAARRSGYRNYHRIKIVAVDYWDKAADWEFTYTNNGTTLHVLNRGFITAPDQAYSIYWSTPAKQWSSDEKQLAVILAGFRPART